MTGQRDTIQSHGKAHGESVDGRENPMSEAFAHANIYTEEDYYNLPENVRAELIDGQIYYMAAPSRVHQEILGFPGGLFL